MQCTAECAERRYNLSVAEKRQGDARVGLEVLVTIVPDGGRPHLGASRNVSRSGMLVEMHEPLEVGSRAQVRLFLPTTARRKIRLDISGEVIRDAGPKGDVNCYGIRFVDLSSEAGRAIDEFLVLQMTRAR